VPIREIRGLPFICRRQILVFIRALSCVLVATPFAAGKSIRGPTFLPYFVRANVEL
jgi:hypothetical protein